MTAQLLDFPFRLLPSLRRDYLAARERYENVRQLPADDPHNGSLFRDAAWLLAEAERRLREVQAASK